MTAGCSCDTSSKLIFSCSGAADVGATADQAARTLTREGTGKMFCLAGVGGRVAGIMEKTSEASAVLAIDGCPLDCARKCLEEAGFSGFMHLQLADMGLQKGASPLSDRNVEDVAARARELLGKGCCA